MSRMSTPRPSRRERLRAETIRDIKESAHRHLVEGGVRALSLRAVARDMGMTSAAMYNYYDTRDDLLGALATDAYTALAETLERARDKYPADDIAGRLIAHGLAYREWSVGNPHDFQLLYSDSESGRASLCVPAAAAAEHRVCLGLLELVRAADSEPTGTKYAWSEFDPGFVAAARGAYPELTCATVARTLRVWGRMHGLVALEVSGVLGPRAQDTARLYQDELTELTASLGLAPRR